MYSDMASQNFTITSITKECPWALGGGGSGSGQDFQKGVFCGTSGRRELVWEGDLPLPHEARRLIEYTVSQKPEWPW